MQTLSKQVVRFSETSELLLSALKTKTNMRPQKTVYINEVFSARETYLVSCGVINALWQEWNKFCRSYWGIYIYGGNLSSHVSIPSVSAVAGVNITDDVEETVFNFLVQTNSTKYTRNFRRGRIPDYREPTWGTKDSLSEIGSCYFAYYSQINSLLGCLNMMGTVLEHFQTVRNASIHMTPSSINKLRQVLPSYSFSHTVKYPTDCLFAKELGTRKIAIQYWIDEIIALAELMCVY